jgi:hypothetical protein
MQAILSTTMASRNSLASWQSPASPWDDAEGSRSALVVSNAGNRVLSPSRRAPDETAAANDDSWSVSLRIVALNLSFLLDCVIGLLILIYGLILASEKDKTAAVSNVIMLSCAVGGLLLLRSPFVALCDRICPNDTIARCNILWSQYTSPLLALLYAALALFCLVEKQAVQQDFLPHSHLPQLSYNLLWGLLVILSLAECVRWQLLQWEYQRVLASLDEDEPRNSSFGSSPFSRVHRPWWWRRDDSEMTQSLLDDIGPSWVSPSLRRNRRREEERSTGWTWLGFRRRHRERDLRDSGSVDFESVQEEWASRTEEDPFWWSREQEEGEVDPQTWAKDEPHDVGSNGDDSLGNSGSQQQK